MPTRQSISEIQHIINGPVDIHYRSMDDALHIHPFQSTNQQIADTSRGRAGHENKHLLSRFDKGGHAVMKKIRRVFKIVPR
jgi:hypothetical protein